MSFQINDKVVCVNGSFVKDFRYPLFNKLPVKDGIYCIRNIRLTTGTNLLCVDLVGIYSRQQTFTNGTTYYRAEIGFCPSRFRKIEQAKEQCMLKQSSTN